MNVDVKDGIAFRWRSRNDGEPVLWIHGYTLDASIWDELWHRLPGWQHLGVDLPGHGASTDLPSDVTLPGLADCLHGLVHHLGIRHVVALSFGGIVALQLAIQDTGSLRTLVLGGSGLGGGPSEPTAQQRNLELTTLYRQRGSGPWLSELWMRLPTGVFDGAARHPELWRQIRAVVARHRWGELGNGVMRSLTSHAQTATALGTIRAATLVLVGDDDMPTFKRVAEIIRRHVPGARRVYLPHTGHLCLLESPDAVIPLVARHLGGGAGTGDEDHNR